MKQHCIVPIAAFTAQGDMDRLDVALKAGLDAGLSVNEIKEVLVLKTKVGPKQGQRAADELKIVLGQKDLAASAQDGL